MVSLDGRSALVTGASRNIGREIAVALAEAGADVGITARTDEAGCAETARRVRAAGGTAATALGDLAEPADVEAVVTNLRAELGPFDVFVNNATIRPSRPLLEVGLEEWERVHGVNLRAPFLLTQHVLPDMLAAGRGSIVYLLGTSIFYGLPGKAHVVATKAGTVGLCRNVAAEFGRDGVRANGVVAGLVDTDREMANYPNFEAIESRFLEKSALGRVIEPREVATVCRFLASDEASAVTGQLVQASAGSFPGRGGG